MILIEEVLAAGIGEVGIVIAPGDEPAYRSAAGALARNLVFIEQPAPQVRRPRRLVRPRVHRARPVSCWSSANHLYVTSVA